MIRDRELDVLPMWKVVRNVIAIAGGITGTNSNLVKFAIAEYFLGLVECAIDDFNCLRGKS